MAHEYKSRFATALVFGLHALVLHYTGAILTGGAVDPRSMFYPWFLEMLLVGWACLAAGWPILWQGALALIQLRATGDLLISLIVWITFIPSAASVVSMVVMDDPWIGSRMDTMWHASLAAITLAVCNRWLTYRVIHRLAGHVNLMLPHFQPLDYGMDGAFGWRRDRDGLALGDSVVAYAATRNIARCD